MSFYWMSQLDKRDFFHFFYFFSIGTPGLQIRLSRGRERLSFCFWFIFSIVFEDHLFFKKATDPRLSIATHDDEAILGN